MMVEAENDKYFHKYKRSLQNSMSEGKNRYPLNKEMAYTILSKYKKTLGGSVAREGGRQHNMQQGRQDGVHDAPARGVYFY